MNLISWAAVAFCLIVHIASIAIAMRRCRKRVRMRPAEFAPPVTIIRPLCGIDFAIEQTLRSTFALDYPNYEIILSVADGGDSARVLAESLIDEHPWVRARLLIGDERVSANPKLNNCVRGWNESTASWVILADHNVMMPRDYIQRLLMAWRSDTGLVCAPPVGTRPGNLWAEVECAFLNTYQARWQYCADTLGQGFAQGKTMLWHRDLLDAAGGIEMLGREAAEDAAATKLVRAAGLRVTLADAPSLQPLGPRSAGSVWRRQRRWAKLRRASFPAYYALEFITSGVVVFAVGMAAAGAMGWPIAPVGLGIATLWYTSEAALAAVAGWPLSWRLPVAALLRDVMIPALYVSGWWRSGFEWRGHAMRLDTSRQSAG